MNDESRLIKKALKGDRKAFEMIILRYQQPLINYLGRLTGERETALDFAQDIFLKAYASLDSYRSSFKFSTWLFRIASNHMMENCRVLAALLSKETYVDRLRWCKPHD